MAREQIIVAQPLASAGGRVIAAPFQFVTSGEDNLRIVSVNSLAGVRLVIQGRRLSETGTVEAFSFVHTPASNRTAAASVFGLGRGALLNVVVYADAGTPVLGQTFVILQIIRGLSGPVVVLGVLLQGYVTSTQALGWPGSPIQHSYEGQGALRTIVGTTPAAGAEISETVPTGARWQLLSLATQFTASIVGSSREFALRLINGGGAVHFTSATGFSLQATQVAQLSYAQGSPAIAGSANFVYLANLPTDSKLLAGASIQTVTAGMKAGDQYIAPEYTVLEWLEVP